MQMPKRMAEKTKDGKKYSMSQTWAKHGKKSHLNAPQMKYNLFIGEKRANEIKIIAKILRFI